MRSRSHTLKRNNDSKTSCQERLTRELHQGRSHGRLSPKNCGKNYVQNFETQYYIQR